MKRLIWMIPLLICALLLVACRRVNGTAGRPTADMPVTESAPEAAETPATESTLDAAEVSANKTAYATFFAQYYDGRICSVYLADLTHDGADELIVIDRSDAPDFLTADIFTFAEGEVRNIYHMDASSSHAGGSVRLGLLRENQAVYLYESLDNMYVGMGVLSHVTLSLTQDGGRQILREDKLEWLEEEPVPDELFDDYVRREQSASSAVELLLDTMDGGVYAPPSDPVAVLGIESVGGTVRVDLDAGAMDADFWSGMAHADGSRTRGLDTRVAGIVESPAAIITNCFELDGARYITVDYVIYAEGVATEGSEAGLCYYYYQNNSPATYTLRVSDAVQVSMPWTDMAGQRIESIITPEMEENGYWAGWDDWDTLMRCWNTRGESGGTPYFSICLDGQGQVAGIIQELSFFYAG